MRDYIGMIREPETGKTLSELHPLECNQCNDSNVPFRFIDTLKAFVCVPCLKHRDCEDWLRKEAGL